ncbi:MAG: hypothetical protein M1822_007710 [Bathelium mastoideum]|nr:MAG: hypothetical protein M1822_007710 [Bathelium mastoideum]
MEFHLPLALYPVCASIVIWCIIVVAIAIYNVYFHPLAVFPGPKLDSAFELSKLIRLNLGDLSSHYKKLHEQYGEVVRVAPNELSYTTAYAWNDIYGFRPGHEEMAKYHKLRSQIGPEIIHADRANHQRMRRTIAHAFSEKALREQQPLIQNYIDLFIQRLREHAGNPMDMVSWYHYYTFDVIGDLAFGDSFQSLQDNTLHPWVAVLFHSLKTILHLTSFSTYLGPTIEKIVPLFMPKKMKEDEKMHIELVKEKVAKRLSNDSDRPDFLSYILRHNDEKGMTRQEIEANSEILISAGSETTASTLSAVTYYLLQNPKALKTLVNEVRSAFKNEEDINFDAANNLTYMLAVLSEGLRMYPPLPANQERIVPKAGETIGGKWVPPGTMVSVSPWAAYRSATNFKNPDAFVPERWMGDPAYADDNRQVFHPFGFGPRACIGRNLAHVHLRLILAHVIWNFDLELMPESVNWPDQKVYILWEKHPLMVKLTPVH